jgi:hypothetical protein
MEGTFEPERSKLQHFPAVIAAASGRAFTRRSGGLLGLWLANDHAMMEFRIAF